MVIIGNKNIKEFVGIVESAKPNKTLVVSVEKVKVHPLYKKRFVVKKKYYVHDENNEAKQGDTVRIRESKPISKLKRWQLIKIVQK